MRHRLKAKQARSIRQGIVDAKTDMKFAREYGYPPVRAIPFGDELYWKAYNHVLTKGVVSAFKRLATKVEEAIDQFDLRDSK